MREKELRNNAELQVIKIYGEMESAWTRISRLEKEVKQLNKHKKSSATLKLADPCNINDISNDSLTQSFQICLRRLQDVLKELKLASASQQRESRNPSEEIQMILDVVYATVREFGPNAMQLKAAHRQTNYRDGLESYPHSAEYDIRTQENGAKKENNIAFTEISANAGAMQKADESEQFKIQPFNEIDFPSRQSATSSLIIDFPVNVKKTLKSSNNPLLMLNKVSSKDAVTKAHDRDLSSGSVDGAVVISASANLVGSSVKSQILTHQSTGRKNQEVSSRKKKDDSRASSLKSLQNNLEELLGHLTKKSDDVSEMHQSQSQLTIGGNFPDLSMTNQEAESHYSTDFDSLSSTFIQNVSTTIDVLRTETRKKNRVLRMESKQGADTQVIQDRNISCSSSSLNLSSIVDLLGNFSVEDIGSSTLTPP